MVFVVLRQRPVPIKNSIRTHLHASFFLLALQFFKEDLSPKLYKKLQDSRTQGPKEYGWTNTDQRGDVAQGFNECDWINTDQRGDGNKGSWSHGDGNKEQPRRNIHRTSKEQQKERGLINAEKRGGGKKRSASRGDANNRSRWKKQGPGAKQEWRKKNNHHS